MQVEKLAINESYDSGAKPLTRDASRVCQPANSCAGLHRCKKPPSTFWTPSWALCLLLSLFAGLATSRCVVEVWVEYTMRCLRPSSTAFFMHGPITIAITGLGSDFREPRVVFLHIMQGMLSYRQFHSPYPNDP